MAVPAAYKIVLFLAVYVCGTAVGALNYSLRNLNVVGGRRGLECGQNCL